MLDPEAVAKLQTTEHSRTVRLQKIDRFQETYSPLQLEKGNF